MATWRPSNYTQINFSPKPDDFDYRAILSVETRHEGYSVELSHRSLNSSGWKQNHSERTTSKKNKILVNSMVLRHSKNAQDRGTVSSSCILQQQACRPGQKPFTEFPPAAAKLATNFPHRMNNMTAKRDAGIFFLSSSLVARIKRAQLLVIKLKTVLGPFYSLGLTPVVLHE